MFEVDASFLFDNLNPAFALIFLSIFYLLVGFIFVLLKAGGVNKFLIEWNSYKKSYKFKVLFLYILGILISYFLFLPLITSEPVKPLVVLGNKVENFLLSVGILR
jgi:hypothetical protein